MVCGASDSRVPFRILPQPIRRLQEEGGRIRPEDTSRGSRARRRRGGVCATLTSVCPHDGTGRASRSLVSTRGQSAPLWPNLLSPVIRATRKTQHSQSMIENAWAVKSRARQRDVGRNQKIKRCSLSGIKSDTDENDLFHHFTSPRSICLQKPAQQRASEQASERARKGMWGCACAMRLPAGCVHRWKWIRY